MTSTLDRLASQLETATDDLNQAPDFAKPSRLPRLLDVARRLLQQGGFTLVADRIGQLEAAGVFAGSDWATPTTLLPVLTTNALKSPEPDTVTVEALSELRFLAVAKGWYAHPELSPEQAHHFITQVLALNLGLLFGPPNEAERVQQGRLALLSRALMTFLAEHIGYEHIIDRLIDEIWRILEQRPIRLDNVKLMITQIAICRANPDIDLGSSGQGADRLISSLFGPTRQCQEDPGLDVYRERLAGMDQQALRQEISGCARAMHDTGLVSPYHVTLLRFLLEQPEQSDQLLAEALGLSSTGRDCLLCYVQLVRALIERAIFPQTAQAILGLAMLLERGILYQPAIAPALWRQLSLNLAPEVREQLNALYGPDPGPESHLISGLLSMLGQPLGIGQGNNPTCQAARAMSMWAYSDPDYLLQLAAWAARDNEIVMHFEGQRISSAESAAGLVPVLSLDVDPVSLVTVPHLDRIYAEMGRRCAGREGDPHRWINPEFHGWWTGRGFRINVDVDTGQLTELEDFLRHFYATYHPNYNGNQPIIHPQPAGIAVTDSAARFIGWHAITLLRAGMDPDGVMRMYFFNPNNDSGQEWGDGIVVGTSGHAERFGESSLPFEEFASRLYIFHYDPLEGGNPASVDDAEIARVIDRVHRSWGGDRIGNGNMQAQPTP